MNVVWWEREPADDPENTVQGRVEDQDPVGES